jgi:lipoyl(octanoyl) transferase
MTINTLTIRWLGRQDYQPCWEAMRQYTQHRQEETPDEVWLLEHNPVFTQGQNGKPEHVIMPGDIPVINTDRGGQVTYHGPGQLMMYTLIDIKRKKLNVRELVTRLEQSVIDLLAEYGIPSQAKCDAPGVYVAQKKICSIGLRIRKGCSYHGIAFNVSMNLEPFKRINPCGFSELQMTQFADLGGLSDIRKTGLQLTTYLMKNLGYNKQHFIDEHSEHTDGN